MKIDNHKKRTSVTVNEATRKRLDSIAVRKQSLNDVIVQELDKVKALTDENKKLKAMCTEKDREIAELKKNRAECANHAEVIV